MHVYVTDLFSATSLWLSCMSTVYLDVQQHASNDDWTPSQFLTAVIRLGCSTLLRPKASQVLLERTVRKIRCQLVSKHADASLSLLHNAHGILYAVSQSGRGINSILPSCERA